MTLVCRCLPCFPSRIYSILLFLLYTPFLFPGMNLETLTHISLVYTASNHHQEYFSIAVPSESNKFMSKQMEQSGKHCHIFRAHYTLDWVLCVSCPFCCFSQNDLVFMYHYPQFGEGNGTPLQYSCLENPMGGGAWWAAVHGVAKSRASLKRLSSSSSSIPNL